LLDRLLEEVASPALPDRPSVAMPAPPPVHGMVGKSRPVRDIFSWIDKVAPSDASVCVYGESGTGKELIARALHHGSPRRDRPLITLDCTAVPDGLMESHLFGHVKGAFTGAVDTREGVFSLAHTGTLFIDELCELSLPLQAKLLRVIQSREFTKVGGSKPIRTDIRLITATNKDPKKEVEKGTFRQDLYYRVAVVTTKVPPLRERREDIPLLVEYFLRKFSALYGKRLRGVAPSVMDRLIASPWPGNVRQLEHFIEQAVVLAEGVTLTKCDLPDEEGGRSRGVVVPLPLEPRLPLREVERRYILDTLQQVQGNRSQAAKILGISIRCLQYKVKEYCLNGGSNGVAAAAESSPRVMQLRRI
jgi:two-component system response regulator HydG